MDAVAARLRTALADRLVGVYVGGSLALGGYLAGRSDVDMAAVARGRLPEAAKREIVALLRHEALPCPARGLELVLYPETTTREPSIEAGFDLNLNTGRALELRVDLEADVPDPHWFAIDRSVLSRHGVAVLGPPASEVFAPIPRSVLLPVLVDSLRWYGAERAGSPDGVLNACRALRFAEEGAWSSKPEAGRWALERLGAPTVVLRALVARSGAVPGGLDPDQARTFARSVEERLLATAPAGTAGTRRA